MSDTQIGAIMDNHNLRDVETAKKYYDAGRAAELAGDRIGAIEAYEAAYAADPDDSEICFRLAYCMDLVGEEEEALHLYEQAVHVERPALCALMNLAVLYEDQGKYAQAERCVRQVLSTEPNNPRARLFIKDILASKNMLVHEEVEQRFDKDRALLDTPVTDFDLSVRARNCLRKMDIRTLGDLLRVTEAELRSYKNFGESSLEEIKAMLAQRGLRLGQAAESSQDDFKQQVYAQLGGEEGAENEAIFRPINDLELSVRARKALALLNVATIGELCTRTEAELMGVKNFGMTSLIEIKEKLVGMGLSLRQLEE